jgi:hypothetical protein
MRFPAQLEASIVPRLDGRDLRVLAESPRAQPYENPFLSVDLASCTGCGSTHTLTLARIARVQQGQREQVQRTNVVDHLLVSKDEAEWLRRG